MSSALGLYINPIAVLSSLLGILFTICVVCTLKPRKHLPPGPPQDPLLGHLRILKPENQADLFFDLSKIYGDVIYLRIPGRELVVLNSLEAAKDLLEKRGLLYSDRPDFPVFQLMGWGNSVTFMRSGKQVNKHRKLMHSYVNKEDCRAFRNIQMDEASLLVKRMLQKPEQYDDHILLFATSIMFRVAYGERVNSFDDTLFKIAADVGNAQGSSGPVGATVVDLIPILRHFPSWVPGTYYAEHARKNKVIVKKMYDYPFELVKNKMKSGTASPSFLSHNISNLRCEDDDLDMAEHLEDLKGVAATIWAAGTDSTRATIAMFVLAMVLYPGVQKKAQHELDQIVGRNRLPDLEDRESLPYLECILQECYRLSSPGNDTSLWNSAVPTGVPHRALEDDVYKGMHIPKGALVIANTRGMHLDERVYHNATVFEPSRYLPKPEGSAEPYPTAQFGFGRRVCPGLHLADGNIWIAIAYILHSCVISRAISENGEVIIPDVRLTTGITNHPVPSKCSISAR